MQLTIKEYLLAQVADAYVRAYSRLRDEADEQGGLDYEALDYELDGAEQDKDQIHADWS